MTKRISLFIIFLAFEVMAEDLSGQLQLWQREACAHQQECMSLPEAIGRPWTVEVSLTKPTQPGSVTRQRKEFRHEKWRWRMTFYWSLPRDQERPYVVTQSVLAHDDYGLVAECNRYDYIENLQPFPVGICSGRMGIRQFGVTMKRR